MAWDSPYITPAELRARITKRGTAQDESVLTPVILAASRLVEEAASRRFNQGSSETRYFAGSGHAQIAIDDLVSVSAISVDDAGDGAYSTTLIAGDYVLLPRNAPLDDEPYTHVRIGPAASTITTWAEVADWVKIAGIFGYPAVPAIVKEWTALVARQMIDLLEAGVTQTIEGIDAQVRFTPGYTSLQKEIKRAMRRSRITF